MPLSPRTLRPANNFTPRSIPGLALWLDASSPETLYTTDAGAVTAVSAPTDISGCVLWLDGADSSAASMTLNGSLVETWKDKSGSNNNATASGTARPTLTSGGLNGNSVVTFDGTANAMQIAANAAFNSNDLTYFVVFKQAAAANKGVYTKLNATAGANGFGLAVRSDPQIWLLQKNAGASQVLTSTANPTTQARIYTVTSSSTAAGYLDGLSSATGASTADHSLSQRVMVGSRDSSEYLNGYVAEVIHYNRVLTRSEVAQVEVWLAAKWGINGVHRPVSQEINAVNSPTELGGCALWLDASDADTITQTGGLVSQWNDKSGNNRHATSSGSNRPTLTAAAQNGKAVLAFDGTTSQMQIDSTFLVTSNATIFAVAKYNSGTYGAIISSKGSGDTSPSLQHFNGGWQISHCANQSVLGSQANYAVLSGTIFAGATAAYANGLLQDSDAASGTLSSDATKTYIGTYRAAVANVLNGTVGEIIVFNTALSATDRARVEAYLANRWGISGVPALTPPVGAWLDKSGNARHLTQASSSARPTLLPTGISSKPALNFDGTDDTIWRQPGLTSDDLSILMVHQVAAFGGVTYEFAHSGDTTNSQATSLTGFGNTAGLQVGASGSPTYMCDVTRSFANVDLQGRSGTAGDVSLNVPALSTHCVSYSASASAIRKQAWTGGKGMLNTARFNCGGWSAITLGCRRNNLSAGQVTAGSVFLNGRIAEVIAYSRYISDTERRRLELYLARKWSVTLTGAPTVSNAEAQDWIDRVYGNGGSVSSSTAAAVNTLCQSITDAGIRDRFYRLNLFCGTGLNAALTPLYLGPTPLGIRYGNTTDTNVGPFVSGDYAETGASGGLNNASRTKYLNTGFPTNTVPAGGRHLAFYERTFVNADYDEFMGSESAASISQQFALGHQSSASTVAFRFGASTSAVQSGAASAGAFWLGVHDSSTGGVVYKNGDLDRTGTLAAATPTTSEIHIFGINRASSGGNVDRYGGTSGGYSIGVSMTAAQAAAYNTAMQTFQTALGRNV